MKTFIDTNVVVCANDARDPVKQDQAIALVRTAIQDGTGVLSTQVLQEYAVVAVGKLNQDEDTVLEQVTLLEALEVVVLLPALVRRALELRHRYKIGYWDASIIACAEHAKCARLLTEDLNEGQVYAGVRVVSPWS